MSNNEPNSDSIHDEMERIYTEIPTADIPWNIESPPRPLVELVESRVSGNFLVADVLGGLDEVSETFDFAYDWSLLHHIYPEKRKEYVQTVHRLLAKGGKYISVCFSEKDSTFDGSGKLRQTPLGTVLYFSSEEELRELFSPRFAVRTLKTIEVEGKRGPHLMNYAFMEKG